MDNSIKIILIVIVVFMLLGCSCSCKNKEQFSNKALNDICGMEFKNCTTTDNCVVWDGNKYEPAHNDCESKYCKCRNEGSICECKEKKTAETAADSDIPDCNFSEKQCFAFFKMKKKSKKDINFTTHNWYPRGCTMNKGLEIVNFNTTDPTKSTKFISGVDYGICNSNKAEKKTAEAAAEADDPAPKQGGVDKKQDAAKKS